MQLLLLAIALACPRVLGSSNQEPSLDALIDLELPDAEADITGLLASPARTLLMHWRTHPCQSHFWRMG